jgi:mRNA interferase RelE/StbE
MYSVLVSRTFEKQFHTIEEDARSRIRKALEGLSSDPFTPRPGMDIKALTATRPKKHRLRVRNYRIVYVVEDKTVRVIEVFKRGRGYEETP